MKKLYRSREDKVFTGLVGGLGEYLHTDPVVLRLIWLLIVIFTGFVPGIVAYLLASLVVPLQPEEALAPIEKKTEDAV